MPPGGRTFTSDLRVRIAATGLTTYPDVAVICGPTLRAPEDPLAVTNPVLLVEITSPSTEDYDRGEKLRHYNPQPAHSRGTAAEALLLVGRRALQEPSIRSDDEIGVPGLSIAHTGQMCSSDFAIAFSTTLRSTPPQTTNSSSILVNTVGCSERRCPRALTRSPPTG